MKTFYDLSSAEKAQLTPEEVQYYARLECANQGIIIPIKPKSEVQSLPEPEQTVFNIGYEGTYFISHKQATDYAEMKSRAVVISSKGSNYVLTGKTEKLNDVGSKKVYSERQMEVLSDVIESNKIAEVEWKEYNEAIQKYTEIESDIWNEVRDVIHQASRVERYNSIFADYVELAKGNKSMGYDFFVKAYHDAKLDDVDYSIVQDMIRDLKPEDELPLE